MKLLPLHLARCEPAKPCAQAERCARCTRTDEDEFRDVIDASRQHSHSRGCTMFIDERGEALFALLIESERMRHLRTRKSGLRASVTRVSITPVNPMRCWWPSIK